MALGVTIQQIRDKFQPEYWKGTLESFRDYYLQSLCENGNFVYYTDEKGEQTKLNAINHHPVLKEYEVWLEGYQVTGEFGEAQLMGKTLARNFAQARHIICCENYLKRAGEINNPEHIGYTNPGRWDYHPSEGTYWGCRFFWNRELAIKSFG